MVPNACVLESREPALALVPELPCALTSCVAFSCSLCQRLCSRFRPQGKSYLFFTQFKAEVRGAKIEHAMAYVSPI